MMELAMQHHAQPQPVRPAVDARRVRAQSQGGRVPSNHRAEPSHPPVTRRHGALQPATDADARLRHGPQQVPDGQPDVQD